MEIRYALHARLRMKRRHITHDDIIVILRFPEKVNHIGDKWLARKHIGRGTVEVVYLKRKYIKVLTVYWV